MRLHLILIIFFLFLTGCVSPKVPLEPISVHWKSKLQEQNNWQIAGKLAFISPEKRQSANFNWQTEPSNSMLSLTSFIGSQILKLNQYPDYAELFFDDKNYTATSAEELLYNLTRMQLPLAQSDAWLKGTFTSPSMVLDELERIQSATILNHRGELWQISYQDYIMQDGFWLAQILTLTHGQIKVKIQINHWQFSS